MNFKIDKLTRIKKVCFGKSINYRIRLEQEYGGGNESSVELSYSFQSDPVIRVTPQISIKSDRFQILDFELETPKGTFKVNKINIDLKITIKSQENTIKLENETLLHSSDSTNILMFADFLRAPVYFLIAQHLVEKGGHVTLITNDDSELEQFFDYAKPIPTIVIGQPDLAMSYKNIDLFFSDDVYVKYGPSDSVRVCMPHSLSESPELPFNKSGLSLQHAFLTADYFFMTSPEEEGFIDLIATLSDSYPLELTQNREPFIRFVPIGYPKISLLRHHLLGNKNRSALLFAPSSRELSGISIERTKDICLSLLQAYPDREIIYRPYPDRTQGVGIDEVVEELTQFNNFTFDFSKSSITSLEKAEYVFTDSSSLAVSFSLATGVPHFRITPEEDVKGNGISEKEGWIELSQLKQIFVCIDEVEKNQQYWSEKMKLYEESNTYDVDNVFENITSSILKIANSKVLNSQLEIKRSFTDLSHLTSDVFIDYIKSRPFMWIEWQIKPLMINYIDQRFDKEKTEIILKLNTDLKDKIPSESSLNHELYIN